VVSIDKSLNEVEVEHQVMNLLPILKKSDMLRELVMKDSLRYSAVNLVKPSQSGQMSYLKPLGNSEIDPYEQELKKQYPEAFQGPVSEKEAYQVLERMEMNGILGKAYVTRVYKKIEHNGDRYTGEIIKEGD
jgi:hypothetical protein